MSTDSGFWFGQGATFYKGATSKSAKFNDGDSDHLTFTPGSASSGTDRRKITHSVWIKRTTLGTDQAIYSSTQSGVDDYYQWRFNTDDTMTLFLDVNDSNFGYDTTEKYRDVSSWYHFVLIIDTTQGTPANRVKLYVNGTLQTLAAKYSGTHVSEDFETYVMDGTEDAIGEFNYNNSAYFDGYMCDFITTVGQTNAYDDFGELKEGVWIPKAYSGSYGANGFRLEFKQTGTGTAGDDTVGADTANNNDFTSSGHPTGGIVDNPENNFCTMNPLDKGTNATNMTAAEGNLKFSHTSTGAWQGHRGTFPVSSGKWYYEVQLVTRPVNTTENYGIGFYNAAKYNALYYGLAGNLAFGMYSNTATTYKDTATTGYGTAADADGETYMVALDADNGKIWFGLEGTWMASGDPAGDSNPSISSAGSHTWIPVCSSYAYSTPYAVFSYNFGQDGTFVGTKTAGDNADDNGHGNFLYDVPAGFLAMCSANLDDSTIGPNAIGKTQADDHFNAVIYSGDGNPQAITGVGFQPDLLWIKKRNATDSHVLFDSTRGPASGAKHRLFSDTTAIESDGGVTAIGVDGFTVDGAYGSSGENLKTYVAWNWKANAGTTSSNTEGDKTATLQANTTAGFSIVKYAGSSSSETVGHGLDSAPEMVIVKSLTDTERWCVFHTKTSTAYMYLNEDYLPETSNADERFGNSTSVVVPSSTLVTLGANNSDVNENGDDYIMYCFHSVAGYSKFGTYAGIGGTDGSYVYTGFKPKWIMVKSISSAVDNWAIYDSVRDTYNVRDSYLLADTNGAEATHSTAVVDFLSNGFKWRGAVNFGNNSSRTYAYAAFAEAPFKYANAG